MPVIEYDYKIGQIKSEIERLDAKNIILQFPEGLKTDAIDVSNSIQEVVPYVNIIIDADPCFGACDLADNKVNHHIDLVVTRMN